MTDLINATTSRTRQPEFEMVGLHHNSQGRCCSMHSHCGKHVEEGDVLRLVKIVVQLGPDEPPEEAIKLVKIVDGTKGCNVGFIPRAFARLDRVKSKIGSYCFVLEMYDISTNKYRSLNQIMNAISVAVLINDLRPPPDNRDRTIGSIPRFLV
jgi:hypothetical protein